MSTEIYLSNADDKATQIIKETEKLEDDEVIEVVEPEVKKEVDNE